MAPAARDLYTDRARIYRSHGDVAAAEADENRARNVPRNWPGPGEFMLFLALGLLLSWPKAILCPAAAIFIRRRAASMTAAAAVGVVEAAWPFSGFDAVVLSGLAGLGPRAGRLRAVTLGEPKTDGFLTKCALPRHKMAERGP
jgi:hypothetical protein